MMHWITANEMKQGIEKMKQDKEHMKGILEKWGNAMQKPVDESLGLLDAMQKVITHAETCKKYVMENNLEKDDVHYEHFLNFLDTDGKKQKDALDVYVNEFKQTDEETKKENVPEDSLGKLVHTMQMYYFHDAFQQLYQFMSSYNKTLLVMYRYIRKIEEKKGA